MTITDRANSSLIVISVSCLIHRLLSIATSYYQAESLLQQQAISTTLQRHIFLQRGLSVCRLSWFFYDSPIGNTDQRFRILPNYSSFCYLKKSHGSSLESFWSCLWQHCSTRVWRIVAGLKLIVGALLEAVRRLRDAIILTLFFLSIFALIGLQLYEGTLLTKCVLRPAPGVLRYATRSEKKAYYGARCKLLQC